LRIFLISQLDIPPSIVKNAQKKPDRYLKTDQVLATDWQFLNRPLAKVYNHEKMRVALQLRHVGVEALAGQP